MKHQYAFLLGSHPDLSAVEAWVVLQRHQHAPELVAASPDALIVATSKPFPDHGINHLGGVDRIAEVIGVQAEPWTAEALWPLLSPTITGKKITFGISAIGMSGQRTRTLGQELKTIVKEHGLRGRFITSRGHSSRLNAAQVIFNQLHQPPNFEISLVKLGQQHFALRTLQVQDIVAYEQRDTGRPARDARVGMLPPKLAQIMVNLASASLPFASQPTLLDPFCGLGTVVQEGWLLGTHMLGSDSSAAMIAATQQNLAVLNGSRVAATPPPRLFQHDVRQPFPRELTGTIDAIVTEPYLGRPLTQALSSREAPAYLEPLAELYLKFFTHAHPLLKPAGQILLALPALRRGSRGGNTFTLLPDGFLDAVRELGYSTDQLIPQELAATFPPSPRGSLLYARPKALVGRELTLWTKS